jgi:hypothetical protein
MVDEIAVPDRTILRRILAPAVLKPIAYVIVLGLIISYLTRLKEQQITMGSFTPSNLGWVHGTSDGRLQQAIERDDGAAVARLLKIVPREKIRPNVVERLSFDRTAHALTAFLDAAWDPNGIHGDGSPVLAAIGASQPKALALLLSRGGNPNGLEGGKNAIVLASGYGPRSAEIIRELASAHVKFDSIASYTERGRARFGISEQVRMRPISIVAQRGNLTALRELIKLGANVNGVRGEDMPPLVAASVGMDPLNSTKILLAAGAKPGEKGRAYLAVAPRKYHPLVGTALYFNAALDHPRTVKLLVESGANPRDPAGDGRTALTAAKGASLKWLQDLHAGRAESNDKS